MKNYGIWICIAGLFLALAVTACVREADESAEEPAKAPELEILADEAAPPPPSGLIRLQERPPFKVDDNKLTIAMLDDSGQREARAGDKPVELLEPRPEK